jgi:dihydroxyacetone kinase-like protein
MQVAELKPCIDSLTAGMEAAAEELNALDGELGDGDLGVTMVRGCRHLQEVREALPEDWSKALLQCSQAFTKSSGSSYGTLLATGILAMAKTKRGQTELHAAEWPLLLQTALEAMKARGKAELGQKTVLDAIEATRVALAHTETPTLAVAVAATQRCLDEFRERPCQLGRARIFGDKSIGLDDPGMVAFLRILESLQRAAQPT